jgi:hypothetical protein
MMVTPFCEKNLKRENSLVNPQADFAFHAFLLRPSASSYSEANL